MNGQGRGVGVRHKYSVRSSSVSLENPDYYKGKLFLSIEYQLINTDLAIVIVVVYSEQIP